MARSSTKHFINQEDLEYMSLNYRKERAAKLCHSRRRMVLIMYQQDISYFPTLAEIRDEIVQAQIFELQAQSSTWNNDTKFERLKNQYQLNWELLFKLGTYGHSMYKPLTAKILSNPEHPITRHILYIYSMESFIYADMNQACRVKDASKIRFYGAFAAALSYIIYNANRNRKD